MEHTIDLCTSRIVLSHQKGMLHIRTVNFTLIGKIVRVMTIRIGGIQYGRIQDGNH